MGCGNSRNSKNDVANGQIKIAPKNDLATNQAAPLDRIKMIEAIKKND